MECQALKQAIFRLLLMTSSPLPHRLNSEKHQASKKIQSKTPKTTALMSKLMHLNLKMENQRVVNRTNKEIQEEGMILSHSN